VNVNSILSRVVMSALLLPSFVPLSVRPSVCHTGDPRFNGPIYRNMLYTAR